MPRAMLLGSRTTSKLSLRINAQIRRSRRDRGDFPESLPVSRCRAESQCVARLRSRRWRQHSLRVRHSPAPAQGSTWRAQICSSRAFTVLLDEFDRTTLDAVPAARQSFSRPKHLMASVLIFDCVTASESGPLHLSRFPPGTRFPRVLTGAAELPFRPIPLAIRYPGANNLRVK
jgi:hypothetical protein